MNSLNFFLRAWLLGVCVFIPAFIIALVMLRAPLRAFWVSLVFTLGGALAFATAVVLGLKRGSGTLGSLPETLLGDSLGLLFCCAATVGGGVLALFIFNKLVKSPPGQRF